MKIVIQEKTYCDSFREKKKIICILKFKSKKIQHCI